MKRTTIALIGLLALTAGLGYGQDTVDAIGRLLRAATVEATEAARDAKRAQGHAIDLNADAGALEAKAAALRGDSDEANGKARMARAEALAAKERVTKITARYRAAVEAGEVPPVEPTAEPNKHAYATNTVEQNKAAFVAPKRRTRKDGPPRESLEQSWLFQAGTAPDMADLNIFGIWRSAINVGRGGRSFVGAEPGSIPKAGNIDLARLSIQPSADYVTAWGDRPSTDMKWGIRRYNLGDSTVVDCDFTAIPVEHAIYDNLAGHGLYQGCTFRRIAGQAIQVAYRDDAYGQYTEPDNMPFTGRPVVIVEDCHAVDIGTRAGRAGFPFTFFDYGTVEHPGTIVMRNVSLVSRFNQARTPGSNDAVPIEHPQAVRASKAFIVTQYQQTDPGSGQYATAWCVVDDCLFDLTQNDGPFAAVRGVGTILIEDSTFLARESRNGYLDIDDRGNNPSGTLILEDNVSPEGARVYLRIRGEFVYHNGERVSLHTPGVRLEIDVETLEITEEPVRYDEITDLVSPLEGRSLRIPSGITLQPAGAILDTGTVAPTYKRAG